MTTTHDLKVTGIGQQSGGTFNNAKISGLCSIASDLEANTISVEGSATINGAVKGGQITAKGNLMADGNLEADGMENYGHCSVKGAALVKELMNKGKCTFKQGLKSDKVVSYGHLSVGGDLEAESFESEGAFTIGGLLNANRIDVRISGACSVKEIGGEEIHIRMGKRLGVDFNFLNKLFPVLERKMQVKQVEGNDIWLEHTDADVVRGHDIKIGPNCRIKLVEYTGVLTVDPDAVVEHRTKG